MDSFTSFHGVEGINNNIIKTWRDAVRQTHVLFLFWYKCHRHDQSLSPVAISLAKSPPQIPLFSTYSHCQTWHEFFLLLFGSVPSGLTQQPVGEGHHFARLVEATVLVCVLDSVTRYTALGVECEDEQAREIVVTAEVENGLVAA